MTSGCHGYENKVSNCSEAKFGSSTTLSNEDFHNIIGITVTAKEKLNIKLENQLKLIRNEYKEIYYSRHFNSWVSHLNEHRFNHNFENCHNPLCTCSLEVESVTHFFLHCHHFNAIRITLNNSLKALDKDIPKLSHSSLTKVIL